MLIYNKNSNVTDKTLRCANRCSMSVKINSVSRNIILEQWSGRRKALSANSITYYIVPRFAYFLNTLPLTRAQSAVLDRYLYSSIFSTFRLTTS